MNWQTAQYVIFSLAVAVVLAAVCVTIACQLWPSRQAPAARQAGPQAPQSPAEPPSGGPDGQRPVEDPRSQQRAARRRQRMVSSQLRGRDIVDQRVLLAMNKVPRHKFVPAELEARAYDDQPLPIGHQQTISQPYIVALMTQLAETKKAARALDVGTGSGYQAAVLAELVDKVYSIEIVEPLALEAQQRLKSLGYANVEVRHGDGYQGWQEHAPFDVIIVAAAPDHVPQPLVDQLAPGGRLVIPVGPQVWGQKLLVIEKQADGTVQRRTVAPVAFVPMTGEAQRP